MHGRALKGCSRVVRLKPNGQTVTPWLDNGFKMGVILPIARYDFLLMLQIITRLNRAGNTILMHSAVYALNSCS